MPDAQIAAKAEVKDDGVFGHVFRTFSTRERGNVLSRMLHWLRDAS